MHSKFFQKLSSSFIGLCVLFLFVPTAHAAGTFSTNDYMQIAPTAVQAAVFYDGKRETLLSSWTFDFNPLLAGDFYWIIPVPSKPDVENVTSDFFAQIETLSDTGAEPETLKTRGVSLLAHKVFEPTDGLEKLKLWLSDAGYFLPKRLDPVLDEYMRKGWYVVAVQVNGIHIQRDASESLTIDTAHTLPIKITFDTDKIIVPLKFASIDPDIDGPAATLFYGVSSEQFLGVKDEQIDALLAKQSLNRFPRLPLGSSNIKTDLYVFGKGDAEAPGFRSVKETSVDGKKFQKGSWNAAYMDLPPERLTLTHLEEYFHLEDLDDITITENGGMGGLGTSAASAGLLPFRYLAGASSVWRLIFATVLFFFLGIFIGEKLKVFSRAGTFFSTYAFATEPVSVRSARKEVIAGLFFVFLAVGFGLLGFEKKSAPDQKIVSSGDIAGAAMSGMDMSSGVSGREIGMKSGDFFFSPETIKLKVGEKVVLHIDSVGKHTFTVKELGINVETPDGAITDVAFTPTKKGIFDIYCDIPGHREGGQIGTLIVE